MSEECAGIWGVGATSHVCDFAIFYLGIGEDEPASVSYARDTALFACDDRRGL